MFLEIVLLLRRGLIYKRLDLLTKPTHMCLIGLPGFLRKAPLPKFSYFVLVFG